MEAYRTESHAIMDLLTRFGGAVEQVSVDEAYLDMSHRFAAFDPEAVMGLGQEMKGLIRSPARSCAGSGWWTGPCAFSGWALPASCRRACRSLCRFESGRRPYRSTGIIKVVTSSC
jgi:nucleotidyltransferase/DNA polymerase involved in DNA repair